MIRIRMKRLGIGIADIFVPFEVVKNGSSIAVSVRFLVASDVVYSLVEEAPVLHGSWFKVAQAAFKTMSLSLPPVRASLVDSVLTPSEKCRVKLFSLAIGAIAHKGFLLRIGHAERLTPRRRFLRRDGLKRHLGNNVVALSVAEVDRFFSISIRYYDNALFGRMWSITSIERAARLLAIQ